jgi:adenylate cyclase class 2
MLEVEVKFAGADHAALERRLRAWGATEVESRRDEDHYFNAPDRDFARTDEALRVRSVGAKNFITYKGPRRDAATKTREELELPLADGPDAAADFHRLLTHLGYRPSGVVRKARRVFELQRNGFPLHASLDEVDGLGRFAELEIIAEEGQYEAAKAALLATAAELGLTAHERRSYLELLLSRQSPAGQKEE